MSDKNNFRSLLVLLTLAVTALFPHVADAGTNFEIDWKRHETEHFVIYYYDDLLPAAEAISGIVEDVYEIVTSRYQYDPPRKTRLILYDNADYSNGSTIARYYEVRLWIAQEDMLLRGRHDWYWNLLAHEFAHAVSLVRGDTFGDNLLGVNGAAVDSNEKQNFQWGFSLYMPGSLIPRWFAEGVAQHDSERAGHESFDTHRQMVLRMAIHEDKFLDSDELLNIYGKNYLDSELVYNEGYSILDWLVKQHGPDTIDRIMFAQGDNWYWDFGDALEDITGHDWEETFELWLQYKKTQFAEQIEALGELVEGRPFEESNMFSVYPTLASGGEMLAYVGYSEDSFAHGDLYLKAVTGEEMEPIRLQGRISSPFSVSPDQRYIAFSNQEEEDFYRHHYNDLYLYDTLTGEKRRLTTWARAAAPTFSPDGKTLAAVVADRGMRNICLFDIESSERTCITDFEIGVNSYRPRFGPDGRIYFELTGNDRTDIWSIAADGTDLQAVLNSASASERDLAFSPDGRTIYYASDENETGIFNIYAQNLDSGERRQLTNVAGGAFWPAPTTDGTALYYSNYRSDGYKIYRLDLNDSEQISSVASAGDLTEPPPGYTKRPPLLDEDFLIDLRPLNLIPEVVYENDNTKLGAILLISDYLKHSDLSAEILYGKHDRDYHMTYTYSGLYPNFYANYSRYERQSLYSFDAAGQRYEITQFYTFDYFNFDTSVSPSRHHHFGLTYDYRNVMFELPQADNYSTSLLTGNSVGVYYYYRDISPNIHFAINPTGGRQIYFSADMTYAHYPTSISDAGHEFKGNYQYVSLLFDYKEYIGLPLGMGLELELMLGYIEQNVHPFEEYYLGGVLDFRRYGEITLWRDLPGYAPYSIAGEKLFILSANWRFPISNDIGFSLGPFYFDKFYGSLFGDVGNIYRTGETIKASELKSDVGAELRLASRMFYSIGYDSFLRIAHGFSDPEEQPVRVYLGIGTGW
jgi:Tol biopolymer transport system component